jgi:hypothetical protein
MKILHDSTECGGDGVRRFCTWHNFVTAPIINPPATSANSFLINKFAELAVWLSAVLTLVIINALLSPSTHVKNLGKTLYVTHSFTGKSPCVNFHLFQDRLLILFQDATHPCPNNNWFGRPYSAGVLYKGCGSDMTSYVVCEADSYIV